MTADQAPPSRRASESRTELAELVMPHLSNRNGNLHGGELLSRIDKAAAVCAMRHAGSPVVTAAVDEVSFHEPILIGELVRLIATVNYVGRSSMEVRVEVYAEDPISRRTRHTNSCFLTMVALDGDGRPTRSPGLELQTEEEKERFEEGRQRAADRKKRRKKNRS